MPAESDETLFKMAPYLVILAFTLPWAVMPFSSSLILADLNVGILFMTAVTALTVVGVLMAGWASNDKWSLIGGIRSAAQIVSYEIPAGLGVRMAQETGEGAEFCGAERWRQLNPQRVRTLPEGLDRGEEGAQGFPRVGQAALMGDLFWQLEDEPEAGSGLLGPRLHRAEARRRVKGRVALDGVAPRRVRAKPFPWWQRVGEVPALPGWVRPHRASDVEFHDPSVPRPPEPPLAAQARA